MDWMHSEPSPFGERINSLWKRGLRFATRAGIAFALSTAAAIGVAVAITDNALLQIVVTVLGALAFWVPTLVVVVRVDKWLAGRRSKPVSATPVGDSREDDVWSRLSSAAPGESQRVAVLRRSVERSRLSLGSAQLDPDAHELCVMIDRRLPDLIHHELEVLPPDDRHRRQKVGELIDLVEQFARHCSRRGSDSSSRSGFEAAVLRRRFEERLTEF